MIWTKIVLCISAGLFAFFSLHISVRIYNKLFGDGFRLPESADRWWIFYVSIFFLVAALIGSFSAK